jgi:antitoxin component YwqK of YwqJK toxin-antitoxin module
MKYLILVSIFLFIQYDINGKVNEYKTKENIEIGVIMNQDTFYVGEKWCTKTYIINKDTNNKITNVKFYCNNYYCPSPNDTAKASFIIKKETSSALDKMLFKLKVVYRINGVVDSTEVTKNYFVSNKLINNRATGKITDSKKEGIWSYWYDNDRKYISRITVYKEGLLNGVDSIFYNPFDNNRNSIHLVQYYRNGLRNGSYTEFSQEGNITSKGYYKKGITKGKFIRYSSSGEIIK